MIHTYHCTFLVLGTTKFEKRDIKARDYFEMRDFCIDNMPGHWYLYSWSRQKLSLRNKKRLRK